MGTYITPVLAEAFAARDNSRILGDIAKFVARKCAYLEAVAKGTLDPNMGRQLRIVVGERTSLAGSLVEPGFTAEFNDTYPTPVNPDKNGSREYTIEALTYDGRSDDISVKQARTAFKGAYQMAASAMAGGIVSLINADIRARLLTYGGAKFVVRSTQTFYNNTSGSTGADLTQFKGDVNSGGVPDAHVTHRLFKRIASWITNDLLCDPFDSSNGPAYKVFASQDAIDKCLDDDDVRSDLRASITGGYKVGEQLLEAFSFIGPYRGIAYAVDPQPLRADALTSETIAGDGVTIVNLGGGSNKFFTKLVPGFSAVAFLEPVVRTAVTNGFAERVNPAWISAPYEFCLLVADHGYKRLVPKRYTGEGMVQWPDQLVPESLEFKVIRDRDANMFGRVGNFLYEITRAFAPEQPHAAVGIMFKRCDPDYGFEAC